MRATDTCSPAELKARIVALETGIKALREIIDERDIRYTQRSEAQDKSVALALTASKEAVTKAEVSTEKRFDSVNEFRAALSDQSATLMPRTEYAVQHQTLVDKNFAVDRRLNEITERITSLEVEGRAKTDTKKEGLSSAYQTFSIMGVIFAVLVFLATSIFNVAVYLRH